MTPDTDIVIAVRGTPEYPIEEDFEKCVESVTQHTQRYRFIFVDDNSGVTGGLVVERVARQFPNAVLLRTHTQNWFTRAYNKGLRLVRSPRAVAMNADVLVFPGWLDELYSVWDEASEKGSVGLVGAVNHDKEIRWESTTGEDYVTGHCLLLSMDAIQRVSESRGMPGWYFDEVDYRHAHIFSDVELSQKLNQLGFQTIRAYNTNVAHLGFKAWGGDVWNMRIRASYENMQKVDGYVG